MDCFPPELSGLLSAKGRELLEGRSADSGVLARAPFFTGTGLLDPELSRQVPALLERTFSSVMIEMSVALPSPKSSTVANSDVLPKVGRQLSTPPDVEVGDAVWELGVRCGLIPMLRSASLRELVGRLCGHPVYGPNTLQVMCYRPGDYVGPHTDHHPGMGDHYTDVHLTFCTSGVEQQLLVYEHEHHLSKMVSIIGSGMVTAYRLPFWHYTTPMAGTPEARRWLLLASFVHHEEVTG